MIELKHKHYYKNVAHLETIDVYRVLKLFGVSDPCLQHAIKKLLVAGGRGAGKPMDKDVKEAVDSLTRWQEMQLEDGELPMPVSEATLIAEKLGVELPDPDTTYTVDDMMRLLMDHGDRMQAEQRAVDAHLCRELAETYEGAYASVALYCAHEIERSKE